MQSGEIIVPRGRGRGPWKQDQTMCELRRPQINGSSTTRGSDEAGGSQFDDVTADKDYTCSTNNSNLSAQAKEFYPRNYYHRDGESGSSSEIEEPFVTQQWNEQQQIRLYCNKDVSTLSQVERELIEVIEHLTYSPDQFERSVTVLLEELRKHLRNEETATSIASMIIEQSISESNFRYTGARLCNSLNNSLGENSLFRGCLLTKLQEEFDNLRMYLNEIPTRAYGFVLFIAELFIQLEVRIGSGERIKILRCALYDSLEILIQSCNTDSLKCVCQALKLAGYALDQDETSKMDAIISELQKVLQNMELERWIHGMIKSVVDLRGLSWGRGFDDQQVASFYSTSRHTAPSTVKNEAVLYGPDGTELTQEESHFLNESSTAGNHIYDEIGLHWEGDEEMNDEVLEAYVDFLESTSKP